jgi:acyl-CoA synthetase (NDP forming)
VVILKGARTGLGQRAALSHTGALAGDDRLWQALSRQTGVTLVSGIDEFIDALIAFQCVEPSYDRATAGAFLVGNGGGASVLAADTMARLGMPVREASPAIRDALAGLGLPAGTSIENPMDMPSGALRKDDGHIAAAVLSRLIEVERPDAIVYHVNMPQFLTNPSIPDFVFENLVQAAIDVRGRTRGGPPISLRLRSAASAAVSSPKRPARDRALAARIPVFDEIPNALVALSHLQRFERFHLRRLQRRESTNKTDLQRT